MTTTIRELSCADDYDPNSMPVDKARDFISKALTPITTTERLHIRAALGRVLAQDVVSPLDVPGHDNSAMDGWAYRHADLVSGGVTVMQRVGTSYAGKPYFGAVGHAECVRIFTGAVMPAGCDTVAMQERVTEDSLGVHIGNDLKAGQNRRFRGEDLKTGALALKCGSLVSPAAVGLLASLGIAEVSVYRKLRVAFFSTGDELKSIGSTLGAGEIYDSNRYTIYSMLERAGCQPIDLGNFVDTPEAIRAGFQAASANADVVITSGGVSVGEADFIKQMLDELGEVLFWKIAMKPGRPMAYGKVGGAHFFGLPGNPVAVMVTFYQFVRSALATLQGRTDYMLPPTVKATLVNKIKKMPGRTEFQRGVLTVGANGVEVRTTGDQGSGILSSMTQANCFVVLATDVGGVEPGAIVDAQMFEGGM
ncbi:MAG: molybdopterin molybdotransferase MoeA [Rhizobacter sp.]|nr:molybdopterin molybdotransferase MoeA [Burkholderiales bacterium]